MFRSLVVSIPDDFGNSVSALEFVDSATKIGLFSAKGVSTVYSLLVSLVFRRLWLLLIPFRCSLASCYSSRLLCRIPRVLCAFVFRSLSFVELIAETNASYSFKDFSYAWLFPLLISFHDKLFDVFSSICTVTWRYFPLSTRQKYGNSHRCPVRPLILGLFNTCKTIVPAALGEYSPSLSLRKTVEMFRTMSTEPETAST